MARLMLSAGMFSALAAATAPRNRGLPSTSPPPLLAAMVISLIRRVNILPRLASSAPFLCLIVAHFEWPDMWITSKNQRFRPADGRRCTRYEAQDNKVDYSTEQCYYSAHEAGGLGARRHQSPAQHRVSRHGAESSPVLSQY